MPDINLYGSTPGKRRAFDDSSFLDLPEFKPFSKAARTQEGAQSAHEGFQNVGQHQLQNRQSYTDASSFSTGNQVQVADIFQCMPTSETEIQKPQETIHKASKCFYCPDDFSRCHYCHQIPSMDNEGAIAGTSEAMEDDSSMDVSEPLSATKTAPQGVFTTRSQVVESGFLVNKQNQYDMMLRRNYLFY